MARAAAEVQAALHGERLGLADGSGVEGALGEGAADDVGVVCVRARVAKAGASFALQLRHGEEKRGNGAHKALSEIWVAFCVEQTKTVGDDDGARGTPSVLARRLPRPPLKGVVAGS